MKKIIPFKKQVYFNNNVGEITSISLEHTLTPASNNMIKGEFIISGEYKMTEVSTVTDPFEFNIPCDIELHERYNIDKVIINIDDFYYEIIDSKILEVNIDVLLDKLEEEQIKIINEIPMKYTSMEELELDLEQESEETEDVLSEQSTLEECDYSSIRMDNIEEKEMASKMDIDLNETKERCIEEEYTQSIFSSIGNDKEEYRTYKVYIVREGDSLEQIMTKYNIVREELEKYNDLKEITIGDKIIIPYFYEENK